MARNRLGAAALAAGLALSFTAVGLFVATIGFHIGLGEEAFRVLAAVALAAFGILLLASGLQERLAAGGAPLVAPLTRLAGGFDPHTLPGQFLLGLLLGVAWTPCVGPTLGAAATLAAQHRSLASVAGVMLMFGIGATIPLGLAGFLSAAAMRRWRGRVVRFAQVSRKALGVALLALAALIVSGLDRQLEAELVAVSPAWLIDLTTRY